MKCKICKRDLPNKKWITNLGCLWCDAILALNLKLNKGVKHGKHK